MSGTTPKFSRRAAMAATAALPLAAMAAGTAQAKAPMLGASKVRFNRFMLGNFEVTTLLGGTRTVEEPQNIFGKNVSPSEFAQVSEANHIPSDKVQFFFTPTLVNTGSELVLFDTSLNQKSITNAMDAAGYTPDQVDKVVLTHMHGDHIGGLSGDAGETFVNATYVTGQVEFDSWSKTDNENFHGKVKPLADKMAFIEGGASPASGITAMEAFGHTPGHMTYVVESEGKSLMIMADLANHYVWSLAYPDWEVRFDMDKAAAAATRRKVLGLLAADGMPMIGYHMPFPGMGYVETRDTGFHYVPATYQMML